jgi:PBP1b-binding outer membrane lipoprotein LpoB
MKKYIPIILAMLVVGCSHDQKPEQATPAQPAALTQGQVTKLATDFKIEWLKHNPNESHLTGDSTIRSIKPTTTGWHVIFEWVTLPGEPEGESHHFLHVYIDSKGKLEKIVRGPDEIT